MSDINTVFTYFETRNHTGNISTSSYSLPFCYFEFIPKLETTSIAPPLTSIFTTLSVINEQSSLAPGSFNWHTLKTNNGGFYTMLTYSSIDLYMDLYEEDQTTLLASDDNSGPGSNPQITIPLSPNTTYYLKIRGYNSSITGNYAVEAAGPGTLDVPVIQEYDPASSISDASRLSNRRIIWDYGDGTSSEAMTGRHNYLHPGRYKVTCYLYDRAGESYYNTFTQSVDVLDYVSNYITLHSPYTQEYTLIAGRIADPILVTRSTSWQYYNDDITKPISVVTFISGSNSTDYFKLENRHYSHLPPSHSTYLFLTGSNNETEFVEVSSFVIPGTSIYTKLSNGYIVETNEYDEDGVFSGTIGSELIYIKDDVEASQINVMFGYEPDTLKEISNTSTVGVRANVLKNNDLYKLSITSNGMDGEGFATNSFNINKNKFSNSKIGFVVKVKDSQDFTIRDLPLLNNVNIVLTDGIRNYPAVFYSNLGSLSSLTTGGFYKGYMIPEIPTITENLFLSANCLVNDVFLTGVSDTFSVYPSGGYYNIAKKGEDIDFKEQFKLIAFQPLFLDKKVLFEDFLGSIFGTISSSQTSIGKTTYEKIKNFVDNNTVLDYSNLDQLVATLELLNENNTALKTPNAITPGEINRLINLLSINHSRLLGTKNQFNKNFKTYGYLDNSEYGSNLGSEVSIYYTVTAGTDLVAFEKFSGNYSFINTYLPLCASSVTISAGNTYNLTEYNDTWGWGLVLPDNGYGVDMSNYYLFYEYKPSINGKITDGIINFSDQNNTLSYTNSSYQAGSSEDGIISNILSYQIYKGLNLFE